MAVLDHTAELGGAELALARLAEALDPTEFTLHLVSFSPGPLVERLRAAGHTAEVVDLPDRVRTMDRVSAGRLLGAGRAALAVLPFLVRLTKRVRALDVDVIHTNSLKAHLIAIPVAVLCRRPLVWHVHDRIATDYLPRTVVQVVRSLARRAPARVIVNSRATAATLPGVRDVTVAHPGLAPDQVAASQRVRPEKPPVVGVLGRISPTKAQVEFVRASALVAADHTDVTFRIIGGATFGSEVYEHRVRAEVARLGLGDRVELTGFVDDPTSELDALTVCVHTAAVPEPFGQVVIEAMARGVPVVATAGGGVDEILVPDEGDEPVGWLVTAGDVAGLAAAISEVLDDPDEAARRAGRAHERAATAFTIEQTAVAVAEVWCSLCSAGDA